MQGLLVAVVTIAVVLLAAEGDDRLQNCIGMGGDCVNDARVSNFCNAGDPREGFQCPTGSTCCLPLGVMCVATGGQCLERSTCRGGAVMDLELPCPGEDNFCCFGRDALGLLSAPPVKVPLALESAPSSAIPNVHLHSVVDQLTAANATLQSSSIWLSIIVALVFFALFALPGAVLVYRNMRFP